MDRAAARAALAGILVNVAGIDAASVFWKGRPRGWIENPYAICRLSPVTKVGRDKVIFNYDAARDHGTPSAGDELEPRQKGLRQVTWGIQFWSHQATDADDGIQLAELLDDSMSLPEVSSALRAADLAFAERLLLTHFDAVQDKREMSVAQLDIRLNAIADRAGTRIGFVEHWGIEGTLDLPTGGSATIISGDFP